MEKLFERYTPFFDEELKDEHLDILQEGIRYRYVIRKGRKIKKASSTQKGYRIKYVRGRAIAVRMSPAERRRRSVIMKRVSRKLRGKRKMIARKRRVSMRKHTWKNLPNKRH